MMSQDISDNNNNNDNDKPSDIKCVQYNIHYQKPIKLKKQVSKDNNKNTYTKRVECEKWTFTDYEYTYENQLYAVQTIMDNMYNHNNNLTKTICQQIKKKMYGYRQQDINKKLYNELKFIQFETIIQRMIECQLKCYYCCIEMDVLYNISREKKQWTVDRINNDLGHNNDNFCLACLECNLKRRRRSDEKFLFTKQMKLVKLNEVDEGIRE